MFYIDNRVLKNVPGVINFDNSHCEINSVISLSEYLLPNCHNFDIDQSITKSNVHVENIDKLLRKSI